VHPEIVTKMDYMRKLVDGPGKNNVVIVERSPVEAISQWSPARRRNRSNWENALVSEKEPLLKSPEQIRQLFTAAGVTEKKKAISYCEVGLQASYIYMLGALPWPRRRDVRRLPSANGVAPDNPWCVVTLFSRLFARISEQNTCPATLAT